MLSFATHTIDQLFIKIEVKEMWLLSKQLVSFRQLLLTGKVVPTRCIILYLKVIASHLQSCEV